VFVFTTVTLAVTLGYLDTFHVDADLPLTTRAVTWAWLAVYLVVPVLMVAATVAQRGESTAVPAPSGLPLAVRAVLVALAGLLLGLGLALLVAPGWADGAWPWPLTPLTGSAVGAWLVSLGTAAAHARLLDDRASLRPLGITGVIFGVLQAIALVRHGDERDWGSAPATAYLAVRLGRHQRLVTAPVAAATTLGRLDRTRELGRIPASLPPTCLHASRASEPPQDPGRFTTSPSVAGDVAATVDLRARRRPVNERIGTPPLGAQA
jgi:hypothetical protein